MSQVYSNSARTTLVALIDNSATTMTVTSAAAFPVLVGADYFYATLYRGDVGAETDVEIVKVTATSSTIFTIVRGQEGTTVQNYITLGGTCRVDLRLTAAGVTGLLQAADNLSALTNLTTARSNLGLGTAATTASTDYAAAAHVGAGGTAHADAVAAGAAGFMTGADKTKLDGIAAGATNYTHPTGDGNLHVPATSTTNDGKVLTAGATAGALSWVTPTGASTSAANSWTAQQTFAETKDTVYTITDGAAFEIDPANGSVQTITLGAARTPAATNFEAGQTVLLGIDDGSAYAVTWTSVAPTWVKAGGSGAAPTLATSGWTWVLLWKVGSTMYAAEVGKP